LLTNQLAVIFGHHSWWSPFSASKACNR